MLVLAGLSGAQAELLTKGLEEGSRGRRPWEGMESDVLPQLESGGCRWDRRGAILGLSLMRSSSWWCSLAKSLSTSLTLSLSSGSQVILKEWSSPSYRVVSDLTTVPHGREGVGVDAGWGGSVLGDSVA